MKMKKSTFTNISTKQLLFDLKWILWTFDVGKCSCGDLLFTLTSLKTLQSSWLQKMRFITCMWSTLIDEPSSNLIISWHEKLCMMDTRKQEMKGRLETVTNQNQLHRNDFFNFSFPCLQSTNLKSIISLAIPKQWNNSSANFILNSD